MNAGFSSLKKLKSLVMPLAMRQRSDYDDQLVSHGLAVVEMMENYTARKFGLQEGDVFEAGAGRTVYVVPRYPVSEWTAIELRTETAGAWQDVASQVKRYNIMAGLCYFETPPATDLSTLRITFTGGYWWDTSEEADGVMPEGAMTLPQVLFMAWVTQLQAIVKELDLFGAQAAQPQLKKEDRLMPTMQLLEGVKSALNPFRRFAA